MPGVDLEGLTPAQVVDGLARAGADDLLRVPAAERDAAAEAIAQALARETGDEGPNSLADRRATAIADDVLGAQQ